MSRFDRHTVMMATAFLWAQRSTCSRLHVGAVFGRDGRILVQGYNGAPAGMPHCDHRCDCGFASKQPGGGHLNACNSVQPCTRAVHAEQNAISYAARWGVKLEGSILYCTHQPCLSCANSIVNLGLEAVIYCEPYRLTEGVELIERSGVKVLKHSRPDDRMGM